MLHVRGLGGVDVMLRKARTTQAASAGAALCCDWVPHHLCTSPCQKLLQRLSLAECKAHAAAAIGIGAYGAGRARQPLQLPADIYMLALVFASSVGSYHFFLLWRPHSFATSALLVFKALQVLGISNTSLVKWAASCGHPRPTIALAAALHRQQRSAFDTSIDASAAASCCAGWRGCDGVATPHPL